MEQDEEDDIIVIRFDFENDTAKYFKNDIEQHTKNESNIKIDKNSKHKICASVV